MALAYPWFLLGLLTLAFPIALHFFELRRPQLLPFTNVSFIREVSIVTARQKKLKHILVLLARLGFILFLVLIFCQPFIPAPKQNSQLGDSVSMVIDDSPSMQSLGANDQSLLDQAIQEASGVANIYPAVTQFRLAGIPNLLSKSAFQNTINDLVISGQSRDIYNDLTRVSKLNESRNTQAFVFSDFQKNGFDYKQLAQLDSGRQVFLVPLIGEKTQNVYVDSIALSDAFVRPGNDITLQIRLRNGGTIAATDCQVKLYIGDKQAAAYRATIDPETIVTTDVKIRLTNTELQLCRVEIEDFPISFDNIYFFTLQPSSPIKIVDFASEVPSTQRLYTNEALFSYTKVNSQNTNYSMLENASLAIVQQSNINASLRENIKRLVDRGGSVVIIPPATVAGRSSYTQLFRDLGLGSVQWETLVAGSPNLRDIAAPSQQNPFFREVFASQNRNTVLPKASPVLRWSRSDADILRLQDGDGFLASFSSGRGTVYLFSTPFEEAFSDFTSNALFVPVMYRLAMQSFRDDQRPAYRMNQRTVVLSVPTDANTVEQVFKLTKDSSTFIPAQRLQAGTLRFDVPPGMQDPGFYQLTQNGRVIKTLAFNFDKRESNLARYSVDELRSLIGNNHPNIQVYEASAERSVASQYQAERVGTPLWQYCLWAALACLLAEALILRFMTNRKLSKPLVAAA